MAAASADGQLLILQFESGAQSAPRAGKRKTAGGILRHYDLRHHLSRFRAAAWTFQLGQIKPNRVKWKPEAGKRFETLLAKPMGKKKKGTHAEPLRSHGALGFLLLLPG